jgi:hypothetical protein
MKPLESPALMKNGVVPVRRARIGKIDMIVDIDTSCRGLFITLAVAIDARKTMRPVLALLAVFSATSCVAQPAPAQEQLAFWMDAGDHGIVQCTLATMPVGGDIRQFLRLTLGVGVDAKKRELVGKVRLREDDPPARPHLLEIGAGTQTALSVALHPARADRASTEIPAQAMMDVLRTFLRQRTLWMRIDGAATRTVAVEGKEEDLASCVATLERDLADERAARARGDFSDGFPSLRGD